MSAGERVRIHYRRPGRATEVFDQAIVLERADVIVTLAEAPEMDGPMRIGGRTALEAGASVVWFTFPGAWHDIGRFHTASGAPTGLYANVLTPVEIRGREWRTTDLFLDVWKAVDGGEPRVLDADELDEAERAARVDAALASRAREEARRILDDAARGAWPPEIVHEWTLERAGSALGRSAGPRARPGGGDG